MAYLHRLRWPAVALTGMILIQVLAGYLLLPLLYQNESLVLARRLIRYILVVAATVVVAGFLFDDIKRVAAAGGLVSAAIVISLQDVCRSGRAESAWCSEKSSWSSRFTRSEDAPALRR
ncbi:MAG: hypothetical protein ABIZ81_03100 [Opitutaceae bacterium]